MIDAQMHAYLLEVLGPGRRPTTPWAPRSARQVILDVRRRAAAARR